MTWTQDSIRNELKEIQDRIPAIWLSKVVETKSKTPTMAMIVDKALEAEEISDEKKAQLQKLKDQGTFSGEKLFENKKFAKAIDDFVSREIEKKVSKGILPGKKQLAALQKTWNSTLKTK